jgi:hypothetical protein
MNLNAPKKEISAPKRDWKAIYTEFRTQKRSIEAQSDIEKAKSAAAKLYETEYSKTNKDKKPDQVMQTYLKCTDVGVGDFKMVQVTWTENSKRKFTFFLNPAKGTLITTMNETLNTSPKVLHWSDVAYQVWSNYCPGVLLKRITRDRVTNEDTVKILENLYKEKSFNIPTEGDRNKDPIMRTWTLKDDPKAFYSLLGSPNGYGQFYLLRDYQKELNNPTFTAINTYAFYNPVEDDEANDEVKWYMEFQLVRS